MMPLPQTLFDEASARLPLFDGLPEKAIARLAAGGFGRGLLTAALRARLRKAGFTDMGALALATPADLTTVRKIGPMRVQAIRAHVLGELARLVPGVRAAHEKDATDRRRLDRLRALPTGRLPLAADFVRRLGPAGATWADLASMRRAEAARAIGISTADLDGIVAALARSLVAEQSSAQAGAAPREDEAGQEERARRERTELLREQDREWEEAAPMRSAGSAGTSGR